MYNGEYFDKSSNTYYLRTRFYNPVLGRFVSEDTICAGLNLYTFCLNNPVMRIDPAGTDSYILCNPSLMKDYKISVLQKELEDKYGTPCHIKYIISKNDFVRVWNSMGIENDETVTIDTVVADFHGWPGGFEIRDGNDNVIDTFEISDIPLLDKKDMEYFISLACNVGNNNGQIPFAEELLGAQPGIKSVIAAHGESIGTYESSTSGFWLWESTTTSSATWANPFDSSAQGYRLFFRDDIGMIRTAIIGTPGYVFRGVSSFIRLARRMRHLVSIKTHSGYVD